MGERCDESCDRASAQDVRNKGQGGRDDQELEQVYRLKLNELIDRVKNCCKDEDLADVLQALRSRMGRCAESVMTVQRKAGRPDRASLMPDQMAKPAATSGCRIERKFIGPVIRPVRLFHSLLKMLPMHCSA
jgi:hypothetical protein